MMIAQQVATPGLASLTHTGEPLCLEEEGLSCSSVKNEWTLENATESAKKTQTQTQQAADAGGWSPPLVITMNKRVSWIFIISEKENEKEK